jgi:general secretion pathway protein G
MTRRNSGFTLVELVVTVAILALLASIALPLGELTVRRDKEQQLRHALREIREAIDAYKRAADEGRIPRPADSSGYPPTLVVLVEGAKDLKSPEERKVVFLRRLPRDPFTADPELPPEQSWGLRSYASPADAPRAGVDVYDVRSLSGGTGINGIPYANW